MTVEPREAAVKRIAAILRRTNWPLDGHGRYGSIPAAQVNDAASRLYSAGLRALKDADDSERAAALREVAEPLGAIEVALRLGAGSYEGDSWYAAAPENGGPGYDEADAAIKAGFEAVSRLRAILTEATGASE